MTEQVQASQWIKDAEIEYANGLRATVLHAEGDFAVIQQREPYGYIAVKGNPDEFIFVDEENSLQRDFVSAMVQLHDGAELPEAARADITDLESAKAWVKALYDAGLGFHFEDNPDDIVNSQGRTFRRVDVPLIRDRVGKLYAQDWEPEFECPIGYLLHLEEKG